MFINVVYKDAPELSTVCRRPSNEPDSALEKTLLVNPNCPSLARHVSESLGLHSQALSADELPGAVSVLGRRAAEIDVRIMLEYIRKQCKLGSFTVFDLCDDSGCLLGLFDLETYAYATDRFEHKRVYYIIVLKTESDRRLAVLPQLNQENRFYEELKQRVKTFLVASNPSPTGSKHSVSMKGAKSSISRVSPAKSTIGAKKK